MKDLQSPPNSMFSAVLSAQCPRCREGSMFRRRGWRSLLSIAMYDNCPKCGLRFEIEPGFFYGAMFVSYAMVTGITLVSVLVSFALWKDPSTWAIALVVTGLILLLLPSIFRYSRVLFLHWFGGIIYQPNRPNNN